MKKYSDTKATGKLPVALPYMIALAFCCIAMSAIELIFAPTYFVKAAIKLALFVIIPMSLVLARKETAMLRFFKPNKKTLLPMLLFGVIMYAFILGAYFLLGKYFDLSGITGSLDEIGVTKQNFIFVALYIAVCNSFLEEFIFRGFGFIGLSDKIGEKWACVFSAICFALYHITMMIGWYSFGLTALIIFALFVGGVILNLLDFKCKTVYPAWIVHIFANLAINTIGMILFGIF
ncbi:MAG: CPBP family intramembrane metalloprotease [Clostridia bacterium]|nr:CPBP family intramembrane metalloprotease [Clostridia bacterium]